MGWRDLDNGTVLVLARERHWKLCQGPQGGQIERFWEYPVANENIAVVMLETWDGEGEPRDGWVRAAPPHFRRRFARDGLPDGHPDTEEIRE
jgi:hypothetical protein